MPTVFARERVTFDASADVVVVDPNQKPSYCMVDQGCCEPCPTGWEDSCAYPWYEEAHCPWVEAKGTNELLEQMVTLLGDLASQPTVPELEGIYLDPYCNEENEITGYVATIIDEATAEPRTLYFDRARQPAAAMPDGRPCTSVVQAAEENAVNSRIQQWVNEGDTVRLDVPAGTIGNLKSISDFGTGRVRFTIDGSEPTVGTSPNTYTVNGPYHQGLDLNNIDLSLVRINASSVNSDFSVSYEVIL